jgi:hypothetical protein
MLDRTGAATSTSPSIGGSSHCYAHLLGLNDSDVRTALAANLWVVLQDRLLDRSTKPVRQISDKVILFWNRGYLMEYLKIIFSPVRAATLALGSMVFVSGCQTTNGMPELVRYPQTTPREARSMTAKPDTTPQPAASEAECNPRPVPGVKPKQGCDY